MTELPPTNLTLAVPPEIRPLLVSVDHLQLQAEDFVVDSEPSFQLADSIQAGLKAQAKEINDKRLEFTRPIDTLKKKWMEFFNPAVEDRTKAAAIYQAKMSDFRRRQREQAEAARRQAENLARQEREKLEAEARAKEQKAARLKTVAAQEKAMREADELRQTAAMMPESFAVSAAEPQTVASNVAQIWRGEVETRTLFLQWLMEHPEWLTCVEFKAGEVNRLARQVQQVVKVPGLRVTQEDSFRTKPSRY